MAPALARTSHPSMADVAALAHVSHQTVSRVLNAPELVAPATRERVESAIAHLGFRRNNAARALVTRSTRLIGLVGPGEARFGPSSMTVALEEAARARGYATVLTVVRDAAAATVGAAVEHFLDLNVDGIVVVAPTRPVLDAAAELAHRLPVVAVTSAGAGLPDGLSTVAIDQQLGARLVTRHLLAQGYRRIVHLAGPTDWFDAADRVAGWRDELAAAKVPALPVLAGGWDAADGYRAVRWLLEYRAKPFPDALFAANDLVALGVLHACAEAGLRVPEDVALAGFDDIEGADHFVPALTSVRQPFRAVGERAIAGLLASFAGQPALHAVMAPELVVRASTGGVPCHP